MYTLTTQDMDQVYPPHLQCRAAQIAPAFIPPHFGSIAPCVHMHPSPCCCEHHHHGTLPPVCLQRFGAPETQDASVEVQTDLPNTIISMDAGIQVEVDRPNSTASGPPHATPQRPHDDIGLRPPPSPVSVGLSADELETVGSESDNPESYHRDRLHSVDTMEGNNDQHIRKQSLAALAAMMEEQDDLYEEVAQEDEQEWHQVLGWYALGHP